MTRHIEQSGKPKKHSSSDASGRGLKTRVKTARGRKTSSTRWLKRQLNDPYVRQAKSDGYRSRAAYKLIQIDDRYRILKPGRKVLDLGAAPGGWSQVAVERVGTTGRVIAVDLNAWDSIPGVSCLTLDFLEPDAHEQIRSDIGGLADVILSDMAAPATGHAKTDHLRIVALAEAAWDFAASTLTPDGAFLCKVFQGGTEAGLLAQLKSSFCKVSHIKPEASRKDSAEIYVLASGYRDSS